MPDRSFDAAKTAYHEAADQFGRAIVAWVGRTVRDSFPSAVEMAVVGELEGSKFGFRLRGTRLMDVGGDVVLDVTAPCDVDDDNCSENFRSLLGALDPQLDWLGDLDGQDTWLGEHTIDLIPLATHVRIRFADQGKGVGIFCIVLAGAGGPEFVCSTLTVGEGDDYNLVLRLATSYAATVAEALGCPVEIDETAGPR